MDKITADLGKVLYIDEIHSFKIKNEQGYDEYFDGYDVKTDKHRFFILITNKQQRCEDWGYFTSEDDTSAYISKTLQSVSLTDNSLNSEKVDMVRSYIGYEEYGKIKFVNFSFSDGAVLQFAVYNVHNGYYGHSVVIIKDNETLLKGVI